jgi:hypothetical protein
MTIDNRCEDGKKSVGALIGDIGAIRYRQPGLLGTSQNFAQSSKFKKKSLKHF